MGCPPTAIAWGSRYSLVVPNSSRIGALPLLSLTQFIGLYLLYAKKIESRLHKIPQRHVL